MAYVIDTSVFLSYGSKVFKAYPTEDIIIPLIVLRELESKRNDDKIGLMARSVLRYLDNLSDKGNLARGVFQEDNSKVSIHLNDIFNAEIPDAITSSNSNDSKILSVAKNLTATLVTNDIPLRIQAGVVGVRTERFIDRDVSMAPDIEPYVDIYMPDEGINTLVHSGAIKTDQNLPINSNVIVHNYEETSSVLAIADIEWGLHYVEDVSIKPSSSSRQVFPRGAQQRFYIDHLFNPDVKIISAGGVPGGGKSALALAAGEAQVSEGLYDRVIVFKGAYSVLGGDLGFLPGSEEDKFAGFGESVFDATSIYSSYTDTQRRIADDKLQILPLTHLRGRTFNKSFIILDEAQNLELSTLLTVLTRVGEGSKIVMTHDINQRDNLHVGKHQGIYEVIQRLSNNKMFAHVEMTKSERSKVADFAYKMLSGLTL